MHLKGLIGSFEPMGFPSTVKITMRKFIMGAQGLVCNRKQEDPKTSLRKGLVRMSQFDGLCLICVTNCIHKSSLVCLFDF